MAFRSNEYLQRNELVRFQLMTQSELQQMGNINKKMVINSQSMTDPHFMIGIMLILKFNFNSKN